MSTTTSTSLNRSQNHMRAEDLLDDSEPLVVWRPHQYQNVNQIIDDVIKEVRDENEIDELINRIRIRQKYPPRAVSEFAFRPQSAWAISDVSEKKLLERQGMLGPTGLNAATYYRNPQSPFEQAPVLVTPMNSGTFPTASEMKAMKAAVESPSDRIKKSIGALTPEEMAIDREARAIARSAATSARLADAAEKSWERTGRVAKRQPAAVKTPVVDSKPAKVVSKSHPKKKVRVVKK